MAALHGSDRGGEHAPASADRPGVAALVVERITHQDVPEICALYRRVWEPPHDPGLPPDLVKAWQPTPLEFTSRMEGVTYFAALRGGRLLGVIGCEVDVGNCRLVSLAVDPDARRQKIGTALVTAGLEWARHANAVQVWADGLARFTAVSALFKQLGFTECGVLHRHLFREDVRLFERIL
ncbi:MAG: GNAT family N-acetyltransferase [Thermoplasmata archaeon]